MNIDNIKGALSILTYELTRKVNKSKEEKILIESITRLQLLKSRLEHPNKFKKVDKELNRE